VEFRVEFIIAYLFLSDQTIGFKARFKSKMPPPCFCNPSVLLLVIPRGAEKQLTEKDGGGELTLWQALLNSAAFE